MVSPAWAIQGPSVLIAVAAHGPVDYEWACAFADLWANRPPGARRFKMGPYVIDQARENACQVAVAEGFQWIFFLDSDVMPPADVLHRLIAHNKPIVSGLYARRHQPMYPYLLRRTGDPQKPFDLATYTEGDLVDVDACPAGCLLISTDVFRRLPKPWFYWTADREIHGLSEDYYFTQKAQNHGVRTFVDTSVKCRHKGPFNVVPGEGHSVAVQTEPPNP